MEFDYTKPLEGKQMKMLQKDFNTPPPIGTDLEPVKPAPQQKRAPVFPAPLAPAAPAPPATPAPQVSVMLMMMPPALPHAALSHPVPFMQVMHPQMIAGANPQAAGPTVPPGVMMMPMPQMQQFAAHGVRPVDATMAPDRMGQPVMSLPVTGDPNQYGAPPFGESSFGAYPRTPQDYQPNAAPSPTFRDVCSPTYQSTEAYEQYVRDIMNADGDEFQFS
jgi:hypothetical protein